MRFLLSVHEREISSRIVFCSQPIGKSNTGLKLTSTLPLFSMEYSRDSTESGIIDDIDVSKDICISLTSITTNGNSYLTETESSV
ncbi:MAG: Uncharacterised protein [Methanobacteriota archaeon]|nr:MAG: Uncharacterised protein [Euryarchaeota archaeon]